MDIQQATFEIEKADVYKKASLVLSGLEKSDRRWILDNLSQDHSEKLESLIVELSTIGLNQDETLLEDILSSAKISHNNSRDLSAEYAEMVKKVDHASIEKMISILSQEPPYAIAMALSIHNWSWATECLSSLSIEDSREVKVLIKFYMGTLSQPIKVAIVEYLSQSSRNERLAGLTE